jgi:hypothetical protein
MDAKFEEPVEWWVEGTPESVEAIFRRTAEDLRKPGFAYSVERPQHRSGVPTLTIRASQGNAGGPIGQLQLVALPGERTSIRVPRGRGSINPRAWDADPDGSMFVRFVESAVDELRRSGFTPREPSDVPAQRDEQRHEPSILLTDEQVDLLVLLVEETRRVSGGGQQCEFFVSRSMSGDFIMGEGERIPTFFPDLVELDRAGLIRLRDTNTGGAFVVSPSGFAFYEEIKRLRGEPVERVEAEVRHLLERNIVDSFDDAAQRWREAEDLLWRRDAEDQLTASHRAQVP